MKKTRIFLAEKHPKSWVATALARWKRLLRTSYDILKAKIKVRKAQRSDGETSQTFSLIRLLRENQGLARHFCWNRNSLLAGTDSMWLHLGCGTNVLDGFVNLDIAPQDARVIAWNLLDLWPDELNNRAEGAFTEDCIEHFFMPNKSTFYATLTTRSSRHLW